MLVKNYIIVLIFIIKEMIDNNINKLLNIITDNSNF